MGLHGGLVAENRSRAHEADRYGSTPSATIHKFLAAVCKSERAYALIFDDQAILPFTIRTNVERDGKIPCGSIVCYTRRDGSGHCVWQPLHQTYYCFQHSDNSEDIGPELVAAGAAIRFHWTLFVPPKGRLATYDPERYISTEERWARWNLIILILGRIYGVVKVAQRSSKGGPKKVQSRPGDAGFVG